MAKEEFRSSPEVRTGFVKGNTFGYRPVRYSVIDGEAIFEGDIVLGSVDEMERLIAEVNKEKDTKAVIVTGAQFRWPGGVVPFTIDPELPNQGRVNDAIAHWNSRTGIRLVAHTNEQNFVTFRPGDGCSSPVGMRGIGQQFITLAPGCDKGSTSTRLVMPSVSGMSRVAKTETDSYGFFSRISSQGRNITSTSILPMVMT